jgi:hypothetical protein
MKKLSIFIFAGICFITACNPTSDNGGQELKSNGQGQPGDSSSIQTSDSSANMGNNDQMTRTPGAIQQGRRTNEGTPQDSQKTRTNPLYKGNNSDTNKKPR